MNRNVIIVLVVVILGIAAFLVLRGGDEPAPPPAPEVQAPVAPPVAVEPVEEPEVVETPPPVPVEQEPPVPVPESLNSSEAMVPLVLEKLSPPLLQWVVPEEPVRKLVLAVDLLASGKLPQRHKPLAYDMAAFSVVEAGDEELQAAEKNLDRLTPLVNSVIEIDPKTFGRYYRAWLPIMESAYSELGKSGTFRDRVQEVVNRIQKVGPAPEDAELVRPNVLYQYADPALESRSALEKWLWRMGDENREKIQSYLREISFYL